MPVFTRPSTDGTAALVEFVDELEKAGYPILTAFDYATTWVVVTGKKAARRSGAKETR